MKRDEYQLIVQELKKKKLPAEVKQTVLTLLDKKAEKISIVKLKGVFDLTDFLVICQGNSSRHNKALADAVIDSLRRECRMRPFGTEGESHAEWILLDYVNFVVHIFDPHLREKYSLEKMWMDAKHYRFYPGR